MILEELGKAFDQHRRNRNYISTILQQLENPRIDDDQRRYYKERLNKLCGQQEELEHSLTIEGFGEYIP